MEVSWDSKRPPQATKSSAKALWELSRSSQELPKTRPPGTHEEPKSLPGVPKWVGGGGEGARSAAAWAKPLESAALPAALRRVELKGPRTIARVSDFSQNL